MPSRFFELPKGDQVTPIGFFKESSSALKNSQNIVYIPQIRILKNCICYMGDQVAHDTCDELLLKVKPS